MYSITLKKMIYKHKLCLWLMCWLLARVLPHRTWADDSICTRSVCIAMLYLEKKKNTYLDFPDSWELTYRKNTTYYYPRNVTSVIYFSSLDTLLYYCKELNFLSAYTTSRPGFFSPPKKKLMWHEWNKKKDSSWVQTMA